MESVKVIWKNLTMILNSEHYTNSVKKSLEELLDTQMKLKKSVPPEEKLEEDEDDMIE